MSSVDNDEPKSRQNTFVRVISYVFIAGGFMIRWDACLASLPFLVIMMVYVYYNNGKKVGHLLPFLGIVLSLVLIWGSNYIAYRADSEWQYWYDYNKERANMLDYYLADYDEYVEEYEELGISRNDYEALSNWIYADDDIFNLETIREISKISKAHLREYTKITKQNLENGILNCLDIFKNYSVIYVVIFLFVMILPLLKGKDAITLIGVFAVTFGEVLYLTINFRCPERAFYTPILVLFFVLVFFMRKVVKENAVMINILLCFILIYSFYGSNLYCINRLPGFTYSNKTETIQMLNELSSREENLYVWDGHEQDLLRYVYSPADVPDFGAEKNFVMLGGWSVPSPVMSDRTKPFGEAHNYLKLLSNNENVFFITESGEYLEIIEQYIREHYNPKVSAELVETINMYKIYSFAPQP
ncbi:MAG: hypothetical protein IKZ39_03485 [Lachnospiraceae bacterium]|nr:hypothetical protein [Lachnospiraceae bacterium]